MNCPKCQTKFDYAAVPECAMGLIKCPCCGVKLDQEGNVYPVKESMSTTLTTLKQLTEMPMRGDPNYHTPNAPRGIDRTAKNQVRDQALTTVQRFFPDARPAGQFSISFTHEGAQYQIRMTSNAVRVQQIGGSGFSVGEADRELALKIACVGVIHAL